MSNKQTSLSPTKALNKLKDICEYNYLKGKRKLNINVVWEIVEAGLAYTNDTSTHTIEIPQMPISHSYDWPYSDTTETRFPNSGGGIIG